jgi:hypothetical protein
VRGATYRESPTEEVLLYWELANPLSIQAKRGLYLFRRQNGREILYIGRAYRQSIGSRWQCPSKERLARLAKKEKTQVRPLVAGLHTSRKLTPKLIDDVERILIFLVQPRWNMPGKLTCSIQHRELVVKCEGAWPHPRSTFRYSNDFPHLISYSSE